MNIDKDATRQEIHALEMREFAAGQAVYRARQRYWGKLKPATRGYGNKVDIRRGTSPKARLWYRLRAAQRVHRQLLARINKLRAQLVTTESAALSPDPFAAPIS